MLSKLTWRSDSEALRARTGWFRDRLSHGEPLDNMIVEAFATVREAAKELSASDTMMSSFSEAWSYTKAKLLR